MCFYGTLERRYFDDVSDRDRRSILVVLPQIKPSLRIFFGTRYVKLASVRRSEPAAARNRRNSSSCVCDVGWTSAVMVSVHHKTELVTNQISDGSQCSDHMVPVIWARASRSAMNRGAAFITRCRGASVQASRPASTALQKSMRERMNSETSRCRDDGSSDDV